MPAQNPSHARISSSILLEKNTIFFITEVKWQSRQNPIEWDLDSSVQNCSLMGRD
jgi:hypothetical protein